MIMLLRWAQNVIPSTYYIGMDSKTELPLSSWGLQNPHRWLPGKAYIVNIGINLERRKKPLRLGEIEVLVFVNPVPSYINFTNRVVLTATAGSGCLRFFVLSLQLLFTFLVPSCPLLLEYVNTVIGSNAPSAASTIPVRKWYFYGKNSRR